MNQPPAAPHRWTVLGVFLLSSAINYLDRQTLAALSPAILSEFHLTRAQFGWIVGVFSAAYAAAAPLSGLLIDRIGLTRAVTGIVGVWSCAGIATGFTSGLAGLMGCRTVLGAAEAGGIPAAGKAIHQYLLPAEFALGNALNQGCVSLGAVLAPPLAVWIALTYNWRVAFVVTGVLGLLWIPLWNWTAGRARAVDAAPAAATSAALIRDYRVWTFAAANALSMAGYSLWTNWTTLYLVGRHGLTLRESAYYAWIPGVFAFAGGFGGGWLSRHMIQRGSPPAPARFRVCFAAALLALAAAATPFAPSAGWATAGISLSIFAIAAFSVNMYTLPLDTFGGAHAAFSISILVASYGVVQFLISPLYGSLMDHGHWIALTAGTALTPLAACAVLRFTRSIA